MFCSKCGHELSDSTKFCPKCGTPTKAATEAANEAASKVEEVATAPEENAVEETAEAAVENTVDEAETSQTESTVVTDNASKDYNYGFNPADIPEPTKTPGSKKGLFIGIGVAAVAVVALLVCFALGLFTSPAKMIAKAINNGKNDFIDQYEVGYDAMQDAYSDLNGDMSFSVEASIGEKAKSLIDDMGSSMGYDLSWLESGRADVAMNVEEDQMGFDLKATVNGQEIATMDAVIDAETGDVLMALPGILDDASLKASGNADTKEMLEFLASYTESIATYISKYPAPKDMDKVVSKYTDALAKDLGSVEITKSKSEITASDVTAKYHELSFTLDKKTALTVLLDMMNILNEDEELKEMMRPMFEVVLEMDESGLYEDYDAFWEDSLAGLDSAIEETQTELEAIEEDEDLNEDIGEVCLYLDNRFNFKGFSFEPEEEEGIIEFYVVEKGNDSGILARFDDGYTEYLFEGQGEKKSGLLNGSYAFQVDETDMFTIELVDFDEDNYEKNHFMKGDVIVSLDEGITDTIYDEDLQLFTLAQYDFSFDTQATSGTVGLSVLTDEDPLASFTMSFSMEDVDSITVPEKTYDVENMSEDDMLAIIKSLKLDTLIGNLEKANVPAEYYEPVQTLSDAIASGDDTEIYYAISSLMGGSSDYNYDDSYDDSYDEEMAAIAAMSYDDFAEYYREYYDENATDDDIEYMYELFQEYYAE